MNKKLITLLLTVVLLVTCLFTFASCQNETEIDIKNAIVGIDITLQYVSDKDGLQHAESWIVKYFVDPAQFDLSTANRLNLQTYILMNGKVRGKVFTPKIPDDVAPTEANNYFMLELDYDKYNPAAPKEWSNEIADYIDNFYTDDNGVKHYYPNEHLIVIQCFAYVYEELGAEPGQNTIPSIGNTILIGVFMVLIGVGLYWVALVLIGNKLSLAIAFLIPLVLTIGSWIVWGWVRGLIMTIFFVIYYIAIAAVGKHLDEVASRYF